MTHERRKRHYTRRATVNLAQVCRAVLGSRHMGGGQSIVTEARTLLGERRALRDELERACAEYPDDTERHARLMRLLAWNRRAIESTRKRAKVKQ